LAAGFCLSISHAKKKQNAVLAMKNRKKYRNTVDASLHECGAVRCGAGAVLLGYG